MSDLIKRLFGNKPSQKSVRENSTDDLIVEQEFFVGQESRERCLLQNHGKDASGDFKTKLQKGR